jgi:A nuclease family of the HNH/ENDO VII superfamily with conserved AHH
MATDHSEFEPYENLHNTVGTFEGGSCVWVCKGSWYYKQRSSCSYRWQAHHRATTSDRALYGTLGQGVRRRSPGEAATLLRNRALAMSPGPVTNDAAGEPYQLVTGQAFRTAFAPWPNNAHHLIPDAQLRDGIFTMAADIPTVKDLIVQGLLKNKYNFHHWKNMMILPQENAVGCALGLPTHPQGDSHPAYSAKVRGGVDDALTPYQNVVEQVRNGEPHDKVDPVDIIGALEALSEALHTSIVALKPRILGTCSQNGDISVGAMSPFVSTTPGP